MIHRASPKCWVNNHIVRTEQPFAKPLRDCDGKPAIQGLNLSSIVRHGPKTTPQKSIFTQNRSISHPANSNSGVQRRSYRLHPNSWHVTVNSPINCYFTGTFSPAQNRKNSPRVKIPKMRGFGRGRRCLSVTTAINGSEPVINPAFYRPEVNLIASV